MEVWLLLLLPVAAASGWYLAHRDANPKRNQRERHGGAEYLRGLNFLLNEEPDKAIDVFVKMLEVDGDTVETHLALGNLFRKRGEADRAVRIHQNLIARPTLTRTQRAEALLELGQDYMHAGLLDRAEGVFQELVESGLHVPAALGWLIEIYQQEREWQKAIATTRQLASKTGRAFDGQIAQYYCELAELAKVDGQLEKALSLLKRALSHDPNCVRASILQGRLAAEEGDWRGAVRAYKRVWAQDRALIAEVVGPLAECYRALGRPAEMLDFLRQVLAHRGATVAVLPLVELMEEVEGRAATAAFISDYVRENPSLPGLAVLTQLSEASAGDAADGVLEIVREVTSRLTAALPGYRCSLCGFTGSSMHWQCPSCKAWNSVAPVVTEEVLLDSSARGVTVPQSPVTAVGGRSR